jgi:hypothetical protein
MANRYTNQFVNTFQKGITEITATVSFGAAGAPTLQQGNSSGFQSQGLVSVTRDGQGIFTFVFGTQAGMLDVYYKFLGGHVSFDTSAVGANTAPAAPIMAISANNVATAGTCSLQVTLFDADTPAATDPADGEIGYFTFKLKNSTAP